MVGMATAPARMRTSEQTDARIGRRMKVSTTSSLGLDRGAVADLLDAGHDHLLARLEPAGDGVVVANQLAHLHRPLARDQAARPLFGDEAEVLTADPRHGGDRQRQSGRALPDDAGA